MSFILRAALVIGVLSYLAAQNDGGGQAAAEVKALAQGQGARLGALAGALPAEMREAAAQAVTAEVVRRFSGEPASRDTLSSADRRPDWRGTMAH